MKSDSKTTSFNSQYGNLNRMLDSILQNSNNIFYEHDLEGCFKFISPQIKDILGYSPKEIKLKWQELLTDNPINEIGGRSTQKAIDTGEKQPAYELELSTKDGRIKWVEIRETPIVENGKTVAIVGATIDITDRKIFEKKLEESENKYQLLVENQSEMIAKFDLKGRLTYISPNYCSTFNVKYEEIIGHRNIPEVHPDDQSQFQLILDKSLFEPYDMTYEVRMITTKGWRWFEWANRAIRIDNKPASEIVTVGRDITERKEAEEELKISEETSLALLNSYIDSALLLDETGRVIALNDCTANHFHKSKEELIGVNIFELMAKEIAKERMKRLSEAAEIRKPVRFEDQREGIWFDNIVCPIFDTNDNIFRYAIYAIDITERKYADIALKESEKKYQILTEISPVGIFRTEPNGYTTYVNPRWCEISGMKAEDAMGDGWFQSVFPDDLIKIKADWKNATKKGTKSTTEYRFIRPDGSMRWVFGNAIPELNEKGEILGYVGTITDITDKEKAEEELRQSEERYRTIFASSTSGIMIMDKDLNIIDANPMACKMYNYTFDEVKSLNILNLTSKRTFEQHAPGVAKALEDGKNIEFEAIDVKKGGEEFSTNVSLNNINYKGETYILDIVSDITERKKVEESLKLSEEKFSKAFYLSPDSFTITSLKDDNLVEVNKGFENIFGYSREEAIGKSTIELHIWRNAEDRNNVINLIAEFGRVKNYVAEYNKKDGKTGIAEVSMEKIDISNELLLLTIVRDITEKKKKEKELQESEEKFSAAFYSSMDAFSISNLSNGSIVDVNDIFCKMFEANRNEILGKTTSALGIYKNKLDRDKVFELLKNNDFISNIELEYYTLKNNVGWAQFSINKINIMDGIYLFTSIRDITDQKEIQKEIEEYQKNLKVLSSELTLAEEKERRRIAVNLHDHLGQSLAMSKIKLAEAQREDDQLKILEKIEAAKIYLDHSINNSRTITYELSPPVLHELGFGAAIKWRFDQIHEEHGLQTEVKDNTGSTILKDDVRILLFRSSMEIVNNAIKHASANKIKAELSDDDDFFYVTIKDDGVGFDPITAEKEATKNKSFGLFSIRERISFLNGEMKITSKIGKGSSITIKIPHDSISDNGD